MREENVCVGFPSDGFFDIGHSINIVCTDGLGEIFQGGVCFGQKAYVNEISGDTTVNKSNGFNNLSSSS